MSGHFGIPGIGGSLGLCAICDKTFLSEILMGTQCTSFHVPGIDKTLYAHNDCILKLEDIRDNHGGDWHQLPEGPLRRCFAEVHGNAEQAIAAKAANTEVGEK